MSRMWRALDKGGVDCSAHTAWATWETAPRNRVSRTTRGARGLESCLMTMLRTDNNLALVQKQVQHACQTLARLLHASTVASGIVEVVWSISGGCNLDLSGGGPFAGRQVRRLQGVCLP